MRADVQNFLPEDFYEGYKKKEEKFPTNPSWVSALMHILRLVVTLSLVPYNTEGNYEPLFIVMVTIAVASTDQFTVRQSKSCIYTVQMAGLVV
jgi:predicted cation transporter